MQLSVLIFLLRLLNLKVCQPEIVLRKQNKCDELSIFLQLVDRLKLCTHRCQYTPQQPIVEMRRIMSLLDKAFKKLVNQMLTKEIKVI